MNAITFLGTGGGRKVLFSQVRASGGLYFSLDGKRFILDPGPGSLVHMRKLKLKDPNGLLISHYHIDHCADANTLLDGMENPFLISEKSCISGDGKETPCISKYHLEKTSFIKSLKAGEKTEIPGSNIKVTATETHHQAPCIGFVIEGSKKIGYISDTILFKGIEKPFEKCDIIIFNVLVPSGKVPEINKHLGVDGVVEFLNNMKSRPKLAVLQHFSFWMMQHDVRKQAMIIEKATGIHTIPAKDFMKINLDNMKEEKKGLEKFT